jgi:hypothetical protein
MGSSLADVPPSMLRSITIKDSDTKAMFWCCNICPDLSEMSRKYSIRSIKGDEKRYPVYIDMILLVSRS